MNPKKSDLLIVGLGNPGLRYKPTRHNVGFRVVERFARKHRFVFKRNRSLRSLTAFGQVSGKNICLALPQTFMNLSGEAVRAVIAAQGLSPADLCVVCDDVSLPLGGLRIKSKGSAGGHNGLASIIQQLRTQDFARLKVGVGRTAAGGDLAQYVLSSFERKENIVLKDVIEEAAAALQAWIADGIDQCMNQFNQKK